MTIPIALKHRLRKNPSIPSLWLHVISRAIALVILGLILANAELGSRSLMGIGPMLWTILALSGAVLFWNVYRRSARHQTLFRILRFFGLALMVAMFAIFRKTTSDGHAAWISTSYPEILGLLGLYLSRGLHPIHRNAAVALGTSRVVRCHDGPMYCFNRQVDYVPPRPSTIPLALRQRSHGINRFSWRSYLGDLRQSSRDAEDHVSTKIFRGNPICCPSLS